MAQNKYTGEKFATHHFGFDQFIEAYDTFGAAAETKALKLVIADRTSRALSAGRTTSRPVD